MRPCFVCSNLVLEGKCIFVLLLQLFKRRNVATVEDDGILDEDGMADSGYLESQANNMDPLMVRRHSYVCSVTHTLISGNQMGSKNLGFMFKLIFGSFFCKTQAGGCRGAFLYHVLNSTSFDACSDIDT